jgi:hypothetical protein
LRQDEAERIPWCETTTITASPTQPKANQPANTPPHRKPATKATDQVARLSNAAQKESDAFSPRNRVIS